MLYVQDRIANSDILDEYGLINYAQSKLSDENIHSVEQALEELESKTDLHEQWVPVGNSDKILEQAKEELNAYFNIALEKYVADQEKGMPTIIGLTDLLFSRSRSFAEKNARDAIEFYETAQSHSLHFAVDTWIDQNYLDAVSKVVTWNEIVDIYVEDTIKRIHPDLPDMDLGELRSYLIANIDEVQREYPDFSHIIDTLKENNNPELLASDGKSNREDLLEKAQQKLGNFQIAAVYNPDTSSFDSFLEDVNTFNSVSDAVDEFIEPNVNEWIDEDEGFFEDYLPESSEEYVGLSLQEARFKYLKEEPNCVTYLNYLKATMDLESVVESVGFNDIFYSVDAIVDYYIKSK